MNEKLWTFKFFIFVTCILAALQLSLRLVLYYGILSKFISIVSLFLQLIICHDLIEIAVRKIFPPSSSLWLRIAGGYVLPTLIILTFFGVVQIFFASICITYTIVNMLNSLFVFLLICISLLRKQTRVMISKSLWFSVLISILTFNMVAATPHSTCVDDDLKPNVTIEATYFDSTISKNWFY